MDESRKHVSRILQQQPHRDSDDPLRQKQQQSGGPGFPPGAQADGGEEPKGEGSYEGTRQYQARVKDYVKRADIQRDAEAARPRSESEAREMENAEREGRSHAKDRER
ncbi:MAG TPA: hypothetical protein VLJ86_27180 [Ramlibacter sp.]|nr:hypothetical protein [Ramlibacter sp.]